jgi:hypothetical protein
MPHRKCSVSDNRTNHIITEPEIAAIQSMGRKTAKTNRLQKSAPTTPLTSQDIGTVI